MPDGGVVYSADQETHELQKKLAAERGAALQMVTPDTVTAADLDRFSYIEHAENVAVALAVCARLGVERDRALEGMVRAVPDAGVLTRSIVRQDGKTIRFFNAFAANDPESSLLIWRMLEERGELRGQKVAMINSRFDRPERSKQLAALVADQLADRLDAVVVMGTPTEVVVRMLRSEGVPPERIHDLGDAGPPAVFLGLFTLTESTASVVAIGNMGGQGAATVDLFIEKARSQSAGDPVETRPAPGSSAMEEQR